MTSSLIHAHQSRVSPFSVPCPKKYLPSLTGFLGNQLSKTETDLVEKTETDWVEKRALPIPPGSCDERTPSTGTMANVCD